MRPKWSWPYAMVHFMEARLLRWRMEFALRSFLADHGHNPRLRAAALLIAREHGIEL